MARLRIRRMGDSNIPGGCMDRMTDYLTGAEDPLKMPERSPEEEAEIIEKSHQLARRMGHLPLQETENPKSE